MLTPMKSALLSVLGVSILAATVACDGGSDDPAGSGGTGGAGVVVVGGTTSTAGTGTGTSGTGVVPSGGTGGGGDLPAGVPLTPTNGWINADTNALMIQGAMFSYADATTTAGPPMLADDFTDAKACMKGVAAKVDKACTPVAPATDCFGTFWGAAIGLNLNQPNVEDPANPGMMIGGDPMPFDGSSIKGFAFEIAGTTVPTRLRFKVEGPGGVEFCNPTKLPVKIGANTIMLSELVDKCWMTPMATTPTAETVKSMMTKIAWQVFTVDSGTTEFDFCVSNVRALQ